MAGETQMIVATKSALHATPEEARHLPNDPGHPSVRVLAHGSMEIRWYRPRAEERHLPHDRDEVYVVVAGTATFYRSDESGPFDEMRLGAAGGSRVAVKVGDVLFVPAGAEHRFENFSTDFAAWTMFYGPEGGEQP